MWHSLFIKGPALPGFLELTGYITSIGIASIPDISVELCAKLCTNNTFECCSIKYSPTKKDCHHFKECVPNVNAPFGDYILYQKGIWVNFFYLGKYKEKIPLLLLLFTESCFQNGQYIGTDIHLETIEKIPSSHDCQKKCQENPNCQFWTYIPYIPSNYNKLGQCYLHHDPYQDIDYKPCEPTFWCIRGPRFCLDQGR